MRAGTGTVARGVAGFVLLALSSFVAQGCSSLNTTEVQCLSQAECLAKGPSFANTTCSPVTKTCVVEEAGVGTCQHNTDCIALNNNQPAICRHSDNTCVNLATPECPYIIDTTKPPAVTNDDTVVIGYEAVTNVFGFGQQWENELQLVQNEFMKQTGTSNGGLGGLPTVGGSPKPVIFVGCNEYNVGPNGLLAGAKHLVNEIQVPAMMGPFDDGHESVVMQEVTIPGQVVEFDPTGLSNANAALPNKLGGPPDYWRISGSETPDTVMVALAVSDGGELQKRWIAEGNKGAPWRVLIVEQTSIDGTSFTQDILSNLTINNEKGVALSQDSATLRVVTYGNPVTDPAGTPDPVTSAAAAVEAAISFKPQIIVYANTNQYETPYVLNPIENQWPMGTPLPLHVMTVNTGQYTEVNSPDPNWFKRLFIADVSVPPSMMGIFTNPNLAMAQATFFTDYNTYFDFGMTDPNYLAAQFVISIHYEVYDDFFFTLAALAAVGSKPLTGANIAAAAQQLLASPSGEVIQDSPGNWGMILSKLQAGNPVTLSGLSTVLSFDKTGAALVAGVMDCIYMDPVFGPSQIYSGYTIDASKLMTMGSLGPNCPL